MGVHVGSDEGDPLYGRRAAGGVGDGGAPVGVPESRAARHLLLESLPHGRRRRQRQAQKAGDGAETVTPSDLALPCVLCRCVPALILTTLVRVKFW